MTSLVTVYLTIDDKFTDSLPDSRLQVYSVYLTIDKFTDIYLTIDGKFTDSLPDNRWQVYWQLN